MQRSVNAVRVRNGDPIGSLSLSKLCVKLRNWCILSFTACLFVRVIYGYLKRCWAEMRHTAMKLDNLGIFSCLIPVVLMHFLIITTGKLCSECSRDLSQSSIEERSEYQFAQYQTWYAEKVSCLIWQTHTKLGFPILLTMFYRLTKYYVNSFFSKLRFVLSCLFVIDFLGFQLIF